MMEILIDQVLDIQILHVEGVVFDKLPARLYVFAHERGKDSFALGEVFELHRQECATLGVHSSFPELLRGHLTQAFVALHRVVFAAFRQNIIE